MGGGGDNNTRGIVWAEFGPVSRVVTWLQPKGWRFRSTNVLYSVELPGELF